MRLRRLILAPGWPTILALALPPLLGVAGLAAWALLAGPAAGLAAPPPAPPRPAPAGPLTVPPAAGLLVHVSGAVAKPGLYRLQRGDRVYAAIAAAGGLSSDADPARLPDLAGRLKDGQQVKVPPRGSASGSGMVKVAKLDLNAATAEELDAVPGFTPDLVAAVLQHRETYGAFLTTRELVTSLGMSQADYRLAKSYLRA